MARPEGGYFNPETHCRVLSNTEALTLTRLRRWNGNPAAWEYRRKVGSAVHKLTALLDCNGLLLDEAPSEWVDDLLCESVEVEGMTRAWELCKREEDIEIILVEHTFCPVKTGVTTFATTIDRKVLRRGRPAIMELKTPKVAEPYWGVQLSGQELAAMISLGPPTEASPYKYERWVAQLFATGKYKLIQYEDPLDREVFLWALGLSTWQANNYGWGNVI